MRGTEYELGCSGGATYESVVRMYIGGPRQCGDLRQCHVEGFLNRICAIRPLYWHLHRDHHRGRTIESLGYQAVPMLNQAL